MPSSPPFPQYAVTCIKLDQENEQSGSDSLVFVKPNDDQYGVLVSLVLSIGFDTTDKSRTGRLCAHGYLSVVISEDYTTQVSGKSGEVLGPAGQTGAGVMLGLLLVTR